MFYGRIPVNQTPAKGGPVLIPCSKCKVPFDIETPHKEIYGQSMFFGRTKDDTLTPATPKDIERFNVCPACYAAFKEWLKQP